MSLVSDTRDIHVIAAHDPPPPKNLIRYSYTKGTFLQHAAQSALFFSQNTFFFGSYDIHILHEGSTHSF